MRRTAPRHAANVQSVENKERSPGPCMGLLVRRSCAEKGRDRALPHFSTGPFSGRELVRLYNTTRFPRTKISLAYHAMSLLSHTFCGVIWHYRHHQAKLVTPFSSLFAPAGAIHPVEMVKLIHEVLIGDAESSS
jgi:hypothetical protein